MNWTWATSLDQVWRTPAFPMWLTLAAAGFFGIIVLVTLLRAEKSVANGALTLITLLAVGNALAASIRGYGPAGRSASDESGPSPGAALPALSCIDDFAGDTVLSACEKKIFGSAESAAAAVSYAAYQVSRLTALGGNVAAANQAMTPELCSAAARGGARPLRTDGAGAAGEGRLHADRMRGLPLHDRQPPDRRQHGRAYL